MKKTFTECDRCGANINCEPKTDDEIKVYFVADYSGLNPKESKEIELCYDCYNALIKFFGKLNPFTGMYFEPKENIDIRTKKSR